MMNFLWALLLLSSCNFQENLNSKKTLEEVLGIFDIKTQELKNAKVLNILQHKNKEKESFRISFSDESIFINFDIDTKTSLQSFEKYKQMTEEQFLGSFYSRFAPYAGEISKKIVCSSDLFPTAYHLVLADGLKATFFQTYVNERQAWGVCEAKNIAGVGFFGLIYIPQKKLLMNIKLIFPKNRENKDLFIKFVKGLRF